MTNFASHINELRSVEPLAKRTLEDLSSVAPVSYFGYNCFLENNLVSGFYSDYQLTAKALEAGGEFPMQTKKAFF